MKSLDQLTSRTLRPAKVCVEIKKEHILGGDFVVWFVPHRKHLAELDLVVNLPHG